jgi:cytidylate kinase
VFPDADLKFFFTASVAVRARRRFVERAAGGTDSADLRTIAARIEARDRQDETRPLDPLRPAADAITVDTSDLTADAVLALLSNKVAECRTRG